MPPGPDFWQPAQKLNFPIHVLIQKLGFGATCLQDQISGVWQHVTEASFSKNSAKVTAALNSARATVCTTPGNL